MIRRLLRGDRGASMVELAVGGLLTAIIGGMLLSWVTSVAASDTLQQQEFETMEQIRSAKSLLVGELRFASSIDPLSNDSTLIFDLESGETVTWTIQPGGELTRSTTAVPGVESIEAEGLVYPSGFSYTVTNPSLSPVSIVFVADIDDSGAATRSIETQVALRNA